MGPLGPRSPKQRGGYQNTRRALPGPPFPAPVRPFPTIAEPSQKPEDKEACRHNCKFSLPDRPRAEPSQFREGSGGEKKKKVPAQEARTTPSKRMRRCDSICHSLQHIAQDGEGLSAQPSGGVSLHMPSFLTPLPSLFLSQPFTASFSSISPQFQDSPPSLI